MVTTVDFTDFFMMMASDNDKSDFLKMAWIKIKKRIASTDQSIDKAYINQKMIDILSKYMSDYFGNGLITVHQDFEYDKVIGTLNDNVNVNKIPELIGKDFNSNNAILEVVLSNGEIETFEVKVNE